MVLRKRYRTHQHQQSHAITVPQRHHRASHPRTNRTAERVPRRPRTKANPKDTRRLQQNTSLSQLRGNGQPRRHPQDPPLRIKLQNSRTASQVEKNSLKLPRPLHRPHLHPSLTVRSHKADLSINHHTFFRISVQIETIRLTQSHYEPLLKMGSVYR